MSIALPLVVTIKNEATVFLDVENGMLHFSCDPLYIFTFFLSCGTIILFAFYEMYKVRLIFFSILTFFILFSFIVVPREIYDYLYLNKNKCNLILINPFIFPSSGFFTNSMPSFSNLFEAS